MIHTAWLCGVTAHAAEPALFAAVAGSDVTTGPLSGSVRLLSRENAVASTVPICAPAA